MKLRNMRSLGPRLLDVTRTACGHHTSVNIDAWPDDVPVPSMGAHMRCTKCGHLGANVRPDWTHCAGSRDATAMTTDQDTRQKITAELYFALERLGADEELLAIVGNMNDTMTDKEALRLLEEYNRSTVMHQPE
jgi:hypothetical protein